MASRSPVLTTAPFLYAALEQGIPLPFRCRAGACGSCRAHLCQSYALSDCRIELEYAGRRAA